MVREWQGLQSAQTEHGRMVSTKAYVFVFLMKSMTSYQLLQPDDSLSRPTRPFKDHLSIYAWTSDSFRNKSQKYRIMNIWLLYTHGLLVDWYSHRLVVKCMPCHYVCRRHLVVNLVTNKN